MKLSRSRNITSIAFILLTLSVAAGVLYASTTSPEKKPKSLKHLKDFTAEDFAALSDATIEDPYTMIRGTKIPDVGVEYVYRHAKTAAEIDKDFYRTIDGGLIKK